MAEFKPGDRVQRQLPYDLNYPAPFIVQNIIGDEVYDETGRNHYIGYLEPAPAEDHAAEAIIAAQGDPVEQPSHYKTGRFEAIDVIEAFGLDRDFRIGNAAKYLLRAGKKDSELQDLKKARQYLNRYISFLETGTPTW